MVNIVDMLCLLEGVLHCGESTDMPGNIEYSLGSRRGLVLFVIVCSFI